MLLVLYIRYFIFIVPLVLVIFSVYSQRSVVVKYATTLKEIFTKKERIVCQRI